MGNTARVVLSCCFLVACGSDTDAPVDDPWAIVHVDQPAALLSVWGANANDVWVVGGDAGDGNGPTVLHYDGAAWARLDTGIGSSVGAARVDLWWVFGLPDGTIFMSGSGGVILRYRAGVFENLATPLATPIIFGLWGASSTDVWAVGGNLGGSAGGLLWRFDGTTWTDTGLVTDIASTGTIWKIHGASANDIWLTGTNGFAAHWDGATLTRDGTDSETSLTSVGTTGARTITVGTGNTGGEIYENAGGGWDRVTSPSGSQTLTGVAVTEDQAIAVGSTGTVVERGEDDWQKVVTNVAVFEDLHSVWIDPDGGVWVVGGQFNSSPTSHGALIHRGTAVPGDIL
jgi:hypothetical protein